MPPTRVFLEFREIQSLTKTKKIGVYSVTWGNYLGEIKWYVPWRRYCFYPGVNTLFDVNSLQIVQDKIAELMSMRERRTNENSSSMGKPKFTATFDN